MSQKISSIKVTLSDRSTFRVGDIVSRTIVDGVYQIIAKADDGTTYSHIFPLTSVVQITEVAE